jgi:hypothetical protein
VVRIHGCGHLPHRASGKLTLALVQTKSALSAPGMSLSHRERSSKSSSIAQAGWNTDSLRTSVVPNVSAAAGRPAAGQKLSQWPDVDNFESLRGLAGSCRDDHLLISVAAFFTLNHLLARRMRCHRLVPTLHPARDHTPTPLLRHSHFQCRHYHASRQHPYP